MFSVNVLVHVPIQLHTGKLEFQQIATTKKMLIKKPVFCEVADYWAQLYINHNLVNI